ncbi:MAG: phosphoribosylanthranilate isomerase [candidate division Zixibacteria bacterium]|nr:phosphoribosylanthranilate isomerase [candidate division Zixibacteria bacterium]MBU1470249.1 phosphoribosylanthranilate isomerase [candidate division Zixibacteria bacterium]MBU2626433.1 phosphoribosylanthranilate isomerase [candidate division Zixibacteria bacterium]
MSTQIKICGITKSIDAEKCLECGVDFIGMVFAESPRQVSIENALTISKKMYGKIPIVGVFDHYDPNTVNSVTSRVKLDYLQVYYHPDNGRLPTPPIPLISSIWMDQSELKLPPYPCRYLLLDFKKLGSIDGLSDEDWTRVNEKYDVFLAGGIAPDNVAGITEYYKPYGIDSARGTESAPGVKDHAKIEQLVERVRECSK